MEDEGDPVVGNMIAWLPSPFLPFSLAPLLAPSLSCREGWQTREIPWSAFRASWRGRVMDSAPRLNGAGITGVGASPPCFCFGSLRCPLSISLHTPTNPRHQLVSLLPRPSTLASVPAFRKG